MSEPEPIWLIQARIHKYKSKKAAKIIKEYGHCKFDDPVQEAKRQEMLALAIRLEDEAQDEALFKPHFLDSKTMYFLKKFINFLLQYVLPISIGVVISRSLPDKYHWWFVGGGVAIIIVLLVIIYILKKQDENT